MKDAETSIGFLKESIKDFVHLRNWEKYHNPKDLAESICIEAAELLELFQWIRPEESEQFKNDSTKASQIREELADVVIYCLSMSNKLDIDITSAVLEKIKHNEKKYPPGLHNGKVRLM